MGGGYYGASYDQEDAYQTSRRLDEEHISDVRGDLGRSHVVEGGVGPGLDALPQRHPGCPAVAAGAPDATGWSRYAPGVRRLARRTRFVRLCDRRCAPNPDHGARCFFALHRRVRADSPLAGYFQLQTAAGLCGFSAAAALPRYRQYRLAHLLAEAIFRFYPRADHRARPGRRCDHVPSASDHRRDTGVHIRSTRAAFVGGPDRSGFPLWRWIVATP